ncbi:hypothetical protein [Glycomyces dulcitolivorans]|uniref:hypothetical protein n=1 Tax=Glycomyces dulcitolivorans TaxID=2200759 RepID=UPI0013004AF6|nr:hypothetical protein [Glycomyces dulcitolivorans]
MSCMYPWISTTVRSASSGPAVSTCTDDPSRVSTVRTEFVGGISNGSCAYGSDAAARVRRARYRGTPHASAAPTATPPVIPPATAQPRARRDPRPDTVSAMA